MNRYTGTTERPTTMSRLPDGDADFSCWRIARVFQETCRSGVGLQQEPGQTLQEFASSTQRAKAKVS